MHARNGAVAGSGALPVLARTRRWYQKTLSGWYAERLAGGDGLYPWRPVADERPDPYRVWVSEIMLQQTRVETVMRYFPAFIGRFPDLASLARADREEVLACWSGLGYYARARNLHQAARQLVDQGAGIVPDTLSGLRALPGVGAYSAGAVLAIAHDRPAAPVDGNIRRVLRRVAGTSAREPVLARLMGSLVPARQPGAFVQGLMDLGRAVCRPGQPVCGECPWGPGCAGHRIGDPGRFDARPGRGPLPVRHMAALVIERSDGALLMERRPAGGLLGGMWMFPGTPMRPDGWKDAGEIARAGPFAIDRVSPVPGEVRHAFTHFLLRAGMWVVAGPGDPVLPDGQGDWLWYRSRGTGESLPLATLTRKLLGHFRANRDPAFVDIGR